MGYRNYINISSEEKGKDIYRVIPVYRLLELFKTKKNTLLKPALWDDPFENFILQGRGRLSNGRTVSFGMRDSLFGQCWTLNRESDAMWRIYSPDKNGVKIKTTIIKLFESIYNAIPTGKKDVSCFIGKVEYLSREKLEKRLKNINIIDSTGAGVAKTLLIKRIAFLHEKEIRLIYMAEGNEAQSEIFQYEIDPNELIDHIVFDPRMNKYLYELYKDWLKHMNFKKGIFQSGLYRAPENIVIKI